MSDLKDGEWKNKGIGVTKVAQGGGFNWFRRGYMVFQFQYCSIVKTIITWYIYSNLCPSF